MSNQAKILRNHKVDVVITFPTAQVLQDFPQIKGTLLPIIVISSDELHHAFAPNTAEAKMLMTHDLAMLESYFSGGHYLVKDGRVVDYRPSTYRGFIQSDNAMQELAEIIGETQFEESRFSKSVNGLYDSTKVKLSGNVLFGGVWDDFNLDVEGLGHGGMFSNSLVYKYGAFSDKILTSFIVERLVCTNGMVANAPFVTNAVPVINDWQDNLHVVSSQLKPKFNDILQNRFAEMSNEDSRASVANILSLEKTLKERSALISATMNGNSDVELGLREIKRIETMIKRVSFDENLSGVYKESVSGSKIASSLDSHLTQYDVYNIVTEATSHTGFSDKDDMLASNDFALNKQANSLLFDHFGKKINIVSKKPQLSDISNHSKIFFGEDN